ncbi:hypothetical protein BMS3Abin03_00521 [bacterium BMS3Abin03]|nr:hypothetical protein BMS3Abin03_00521 [bacterium BMS3Abin03]
MKQRERDIVEQAVQKFEEETGLKIILHYTEQQIECDAILNIVVDEHKLEFNVEVRLFLNRARLGLVLNQLKGMRGKPLLITEYINPDLMKAMEENKINFMDAAGNAYINVPPLIIKIKGNKIERKKYFTGTFNTAALQVIFTLLCNPGIERRTIRVIGEKTGVATGTVYNTIKELVKQNYLLERNFQRYKLINKEGLLERWVTLYPEKLKPKYLIGRYGIAEDQVNNLQLENYNALWGGEEAAARLTNYLRPYQYTIYVEDNYGEFVIRNRLRKNAQGNLTLMKKFWKFIDNEYAMNNLTHPILVYADLLATGDPRNIETAKLIYESDIVRYIKED